MIIDKSGKIYTITESGAKWTVTNDSGKLSVSYEVSKDICKTEDELREYVLSNDEIF